MAQNIHGKYASVAVKNGENKKKSICLLCGYLRTTFDIQK